MASGVKLTRRVIDAAQPAPVDVLIWDSEVIGFGLRLKPSGVRSFVFRYRPPNGGNDRKVTFGRYPALSVEEARDAARDLYVQRTRGGDPAVERKQAREGITLADLADYYLGPHALLKGNRKVTLVEYRRTLGSNVLPMFGKRNLAQVSKAELAELIQAMSSTPVAANRLRAVLSGCSVLL